MKYLFLTPLILYGALAIASFGYALWHVPFATRKAFGDFWLGVRLVGKWFGLFWIGLVVEVVGMFISPVVILFANHKTGRLPRGFQWMETHDALLPGYPAVQNFHDPQPTTWWGYYWQSLKWLNRNRVYRFTTEQMGVMCLNGVPRKRYGALILSDKNPAVYGKFVEVTPDCFECYHVFAAFGRNWGWRIGYKLARTRGRTEQAQHQLRIRSGSPVVPSETKVAP